VYRDELYALQTTNFDFWIKLQDPGDASRRAEGGTAWVIYRQGVNRAEAEELIQLLMIDLISMGSSGLRNIDDQTSGFEHSIAQLMGQETVRSGSTNVTAPNGDWLQLFTQFLQGFKNIQFFPHEHSPFFRWKGDINWGVLSIIQRDFPGTQEGAMPELVFDVSRQGNRTRVEVHRIRIPALNFFHQLSSR